MVGSTDVYVHTFMMRMRVSVICDRNSIAKKREEFPARAVDVASIRLPFASLARLLQPFSANVSCAMPAASMKLSIGSLLIKITKIQGCFFLVQRSTHTCLNICYPSGNNFPSMSRKSKMFRNAPGVPMSHHSNEHEQ